jgi:exocyst complex component 2
VATSKADSVYTPILDARLKADRLRSTLGVFERSKYFFNLPGVLLEAIEKVRGVHSLVFFVALSHKEGKKGSL